MKENWDTKGCFQKHYNFGVGFCKKQNIKTEIKVKNETLSIYSCVAFSSFPTHLKQHYVTLPAHVASNNETKWCMLIYHTKQQFW